MIPDPVIATTLAAQDIVVLDGALAKASNSASQRGAFFDSVVDRVKYSLNMLGNVRK